MILKYGLEYVILVGGAVGVIAALARYMYKLFKTWFRFIDDWYGTDEFPGIKHRLDFIESELRPNHGSSIKDQINRLEERQKDIYQRLSDQG